MQLFTDDSNVLFSAICYGIHGMIHVVVGLVNSPRPASLICPMERSSASLTLYNFCSSEYDNRKKKVAHSISSVCY